MSDTGCFAKCYKDDQHQFSCLGYLQVGCEAMADSVLVCVMTKRTWTP